MAAPLLYFSDKNLPTNKHSYTPFFLTCCLSSSLQVKINTGVATPERMAPGYLNHLDLGEGVATLVERRNTSHTVFTVNCPADLKNILLERNL